MTKRDGHDGVQNTIEKAITARSSNASNQASGHSLDVYHLFQESR